MGRWRGGAADLDGWDEGGFGPAARRASPAARPRQPAIVALHTELASRYARAPVRWLWPERIPIGALTLIAGNPGMGKSLLTLDLAARVTRGAPWPDGTANTLGNVLIASAEDAPETTIAPRLAAAGADLDRAHILERAFSVWPVPAEPPRAGSFAADLAALGDRIEAIGNVRLVVIDPITAFPSAGGAGGRVALALVAALARVARVAILAVTHLNKGVGGQALYRLTGSIGFVAAARAVYLVPAESAAVAPGPASAPDAAPAARRLFLQLKNNLGKHANGSGLAFGIAVEPVLHLEAGYGEPADIVAPVPRIAWDGAPVAVDLAAVFEGERAAARAAGGKLVAATAWLARALAPQPVAAAAVLAGAKAAGIPYATLRRAAAALAVAKSKAAMDGGWLWSLDPKMLKPEFEHLQESLDFSHERRA